jgi:DNA-binding GntR family transcriptional regulator
MADPAPNQLTLYRPSSAQQVASVIRDQLLRAEIRPGARLRDEVIASTLGVSRNTVREAMQILASEGLVQRNLHRGSVVADLDVDEVADVYRARRLVELLGIRAAASASPDWLTMMHNVLSDMQAAAADGNPAHILESDLRFHAAIVGALGCKRLTRFHHGAQTEIRLTRAWNTQWPPWHVFYTRHKEVIDALDVQDFQAAEQLLAGIIDDGELRVRTGFDSKATDLARAEPGGF